MPPLNAEELTAALGGRWNGRTGRGLARCPSHRDRHPSLSIAEKNGRTVFICRAGCTQPEVIAPLTARGLWAPTRGEQVTRIPAFRWEDHFLTPELPESPACCLKHIPRCEHWKSFDFEWRLAHLHWELLEASTEVLDLYRRASEPLSAPALMAELILSVELGGIARSGLDDATMTAAIDAVVGEVLGGADERANQ